MYRDFQGFKELIDYIDSRLSEYKRMLGEMLNMANDIRSKYESIKMLSSRVGVKEAPKQVEARVGAIRLVIHPSPDQLSQMIEQYAEALNKKISRLAEIRKSIEHLANTEIPIRVFMDGDIPDLIVVRVST